MTNSTPKQSFINQRVLNSFSLKIIAIILMTIDHIGILLYSTDSDKYLSTFQTIIPENVYTIMRIIGRLAFPIFCYMIAEGFVHTHNITKYTLRLFVFAILSQIPYSLGIEHTFCNIHSLNIFFTLTLGLLTITIIQKSINKVIETHNIIFFGYGVIAIFVSLFISDFFNMSYRQYGVLLILIFYFFRVPDSEYSHESTIIKYTILQLVLILAITYMYQSNLQYYAPLALLLILFYNRKKGPSMKYVFYIYYPAHMLLLYIAHLALY